MYPRSQGIPSRTKFCSKRCLLSLCCITVVACSRDTGPSIYISDFSAFSHERTGTPRDVMKSIKPQSRSPSLRSSGRNARLWDNPLPEARSQSDSSLKRIIPEPRVPSRGSQARGTRLIKPEVLQIDCHPPRKAKPQVCLGVACTLGLALFSIQQTDLTSFSEDGRGAKWLCNKPYSNRNSNP